MSGVRAELEVTEPVGCPVASLAVDTTEELRDVRWTETADGTVDEQFRTAASVDASGDEVDADKLFEDDTGSVYRVERDADDPCVCEAIERLGVPIQEVTATGGSLIVTAYLTGVEELREVVAAARERGEVRVRRLSRTDGGGAPTDLVSVDRSVLTDRQQEVLETAYEMGYFEHPRDSNATEVAEELDVCPSTLIEHLSAAQSKLLGGVLADRVEAEVPG
jgi:predicted DNA binding protein